MKRQEIEAKLIARSLEDEAFRQKLLSEPKAAIEEATQVKIRKKVEIVVLEESDDKFYIILPPARKTELSESDLEAVAGGAVYQDIRHKAWFQSRGSR